MFLDTFQYRPIDNLVANFFTSYRNEIFKLSQQVWREEDIREYSTKYIKIAQYYLALYLVILLYIDYTSGLDIWDNLILKYKIDCHRKELACCGIDLDKILGTFGLPPKANTGGIEGVEIEESFEVEPTELPVLETSDTPINMTNAFKVREECFNYVTEDNC